MVNENIIPKTETVYELKDKYEVPSFEEFMKTYQSDGNLNYDDLNSSNVGESKGYGPCSNSKCTCYISHEEGFVPLNSACPVCAGGALPAKNTSSKVFMTALNIAAGMNADNSKTMDIIADIGIKLLQDAKKGF
ncbi:17665_t:CDS:2 [Funneliformis geosporum]|nr:17665_t:CDS:2 [Funneliformis geosporum]